MDGKLSSTIGTCMTIYIHDCGPCDVIIYAYMEVVYMRVCVWSLSYAQNRWHVTRHLSVATAREPCVCFSTALQVAAPTQRRKLMLGSALVTSHDDSANPLHSNSCVAINILGNPFIRHKTPLHLDPTFYLFSFIHQRLSYPTFITFLSHQTLSIVQVHSSYLNHLFTMVSPNQ